MRGLCGIKDGDHAFVFFWHVLDAKMALECRMGSALLLSALPLSLAPALDHSTILSLPRYRLANRVTSFIHIPSGFNPSGSSTIQAKRLIYNSHKNRIDFCSLSRVWYTFDRYCSTAYFQLARPSAPSSLRLTVEARKVRGSFWRLLRSERLADSCTATRFDQR